MQRLYVTKKGCYGLGILGIILLLAVIGPSLSSYESDAIQLALNNRAPSWEFWFGSDDLGRDLFARTWKGARISLFIGVTAAFIDLCIGMVWGGVAALFGRSVDEVLMRVADILYALPYLLIVILLMVVLDQGLFTMILALTVTGWITMARIVRGQLLQLKEQEYVLAAQGLGASKGRILFKHLLPNATVPILTTLTLTIPTAIFTEAFLSFLGLGVRAPIASLGSMASDGLPALEYYPWRALFPLAVISVTMLAFNMIGEGIKQESDDYTRR